MCTLNIRRRFNCLVLLAWLVLMIQTATGQTKPENPKQQEREDVIRVNTELVQTDVMVFDKKGLFVDGLKPEQFALKIDNKPQTIAFFERVASGSQREERKQTNAGTAVANVPTETGGRVLIFFVDDLHLAPDSLVRTRKALNEFIDKGMGDNDQVAITSSSGQIGFLQQFTDDKVALRSAAARLNYRANTKLDMEQPPMSEYIALKIREGDEQTITYYVQEIQKQNCFRPAPGGSYLHGLAAVGQTARAGARSTDYDDGRARYRQHTSLVGRFNAFCGAIAGTQTGFSHF